MDGAQIKVEFSGTEKELDDLIEEIKSQEGVDDVEAQTFNY